MLSAHEVLEALDRDVKENLASPKADTVAFLNDVMERLRVIPSVVNPVLRCNCLLNIASLFYHQGEKTFDGIEPAARAVMLARTIGDPSLLRKSLTVQAVLLLSTSSPGDAITALAEALEIAERIKDEFGQMIVWLNLGGAFYEAALYNDASHCSNRAVEIAGRIGDDNWKAVALANTALNSLHMRAYDDGLFSIKAALAIASPPSTPAEKLARIISEGTYTRLLLATAQVVEASKRAQIARTLAEETMSARADISAACSEGLVKVYSGHVDAGLSRAMTALQKARGVNAHVRETLLALVQAHEKAGRPERALELHRELMLHLRKAQHHNIARPDDPHLQEDVPSRHIPIDETRHRVSALLGTPTL